MNVSPVFILTDFGTEDTYVAQMKASIMSFAGYGIPLVDLTNGVRKGDILHGAYHLMAALPCLPAGSVTLAVVDPGVGSSRGGLAAEWNGRYIVAPDNGLISLLSSPLSVWKLPHPDGIPSHTFHGRDWFAPCAARLAVDPGWTGFMESLSNPVRLLPSEPVFTDSSVTVQVLHTDSFGNCILGLSQDIFSRFHFDSVCTDSGPIPLTRVDFYSQGRGDELLILKGSQGFLELAVRGGSASSLLDLAPGMSVRLTAREN